MSSSSSSAASSSAASSQDSSVYTSSSEASSSSEVSSSSSSEASSSSSSETPVCDLNDADCDGIVDATDTTFSCRGDGTVEGVLSAFRQILALDTSISAWTVGLASTSSNSNALMPGDTDFATLNVLLTGAAGVAIGQVGSQLGGESSPGRVTFVVSSNSMLLPEELLSGVTIRFDEVNTAYAPNLITKSLLAPTGYEMFVIGVQKPDIDYQSIEFRQGAVLGIAPTLRLHKVCIEE